MANKPIFSLLFSIFILSSSNLAQPQINVWPKPVTAVYQTANAVLLSPSLTIHHPPHNHLRQAVRRYLRLISTEKWHPIRHVPVTLSTSPPLQTLTISVSDTSTPLQHGVDESYTLSISGNPVAGNLTSATVWGAMRGLETLSQLVWGNPAKIPADLYISDRPLFPHRGLVLDTSRNFYPVRDILRTIRAMSYNKMNVLHWHITDSHSFPVVLPSVPELGRKGSYGPGMQYFPADVRKIVEFGFRHGVRILPEIDAPGHTGSWAEAYPDIVTCANMFWWRPGTDRADRLASEPGTGQLNPLNTKTYEVLRNVIHDVTTLFPESFYHSGSDEIAPACWKTDPAIQTFLSNGGTISQLLEIFINTTHHYIVNVNRTAVYWEDVLLNGDVRVGPSVIPRETTILQTWNEGPNNTKRITAAGYRTIVSSSDFYYLDCGHGGFVGNDSRYDRQISDDPGRPFNYKGGNGGSWCAPFKTWQRIYDYDITYGLNEQEAKLVLGGETALWSEQADATVLDARVWPRSSAMAEALWSGNRDGKGKKRYAEAMDRLNEWRYRMVGRGIMAEPLQPMWCLTHPGMCNLDQ